jgi:putative methyltransferase (TIGR04325 family)
MAKIKSIFKAFTPPIILNTFKKLQKKEIEKNVASMWSGNYDNWEKAKSSCTGYESNSILEKCKNALLKVKNGEAVYERDSVIFDHIQYAWPLLACLQDIAIASNNQLRVIDFGGSLGSTYFQNVHFLKKNLALEWYIVEQPGFVDVGKKEFENRQLKFEYTVDEVMEKSDINCLLLSSVLQYVDNPPKWIDKFLKIGVPYIIIDRTGFIKGQQRLTVQNVPESVYPASYPCWFFNEKQFLNYFSTRYDVIAEFKSYIDNDAISDDQKLMYWKGFYLKRK